jgi:hypothetical protein
MPPSSLQKCESESMIITLKFAFSAAWIASIASLFSMMAAIYHR